MTWDPKLLDTLDVWRRRPVRDLIAALPPITPTAIIDLGCGGGHLARLLAARWPDADVLGVDNSPAMLRWAQGTPSRVRYLDADLTGWRPHWPVELLISDSGLQRVENHERLFPELLQCLAPGGVLAVALPRPQEQAAHRLLLDTAADGPWADRLADALRPMAEHGAQDYYDWLSPLAVSVDLWETEYFQVVGGDVPILQWLRAAALTPVMDRLDGPDLDQFLAAYRGRLEAAYPEHPYGNALVPTKRLFLVAQVAGSVGGRG